jgi:hypothetical protein
VVLWLKRHVLRAWRELTKSPLQRKRARAGHVGFVGGGRRSYAAEAVAVDFLAERF